MKVEPGQKKSRFGEKGMRLVRSWETLLLLAESSEPLSSKAIQEKIHRNYPFSEHRCGLQTIRDDIKTLRKCGFPVCMVDQQGQEIDADGMDSLQGRLKNVRWQLRDPKKLGAIDNLYHRCPGTPDLITLSLCRALLKDVVPTQYPLYRSLSKMLDELQVLTNKALRAGDTNITDLHGRVQVLGRRFVGESASSNTWSIMTTAIARRQVLLASYDNRAGKKKEVDIAPLAVWFSEGRAYVLAAGATDQKIRAWRIDRFSDLSVDLTRKAPVVSDEIIEEKLRTSFKGFISDPALIQLKVKPEAAYLFREFQYHPSQKITEHSDGSVEVTMECTMGWGLEEWILGLGEMVNVDKPEVLRERIKNRLKITLSQYM